MPRRDKAGGKYDKPGGRALERLRQFEGERGLGATTPEPVSPQQPTVRKKVKAKRPDRDT